MPLVDSFGRIHTNLRISVTDRCNLRCFYCMPTEVVQFKPRDELLSYEEIERFVRVVAGLGVNKIRLTGGEPLVRANIASLVRRLAAVDGIVDLALTTNGLLLPELAAELRAAGLHRLNISLDALDEDSFRRIARRKGLDRVLAGVAAAKEAGFRRIRLNAVSIRGLTEKQIIPLARFARQHGLELRFIEFMPLDADGVWQKDQVLSGDHVRAILSREVGELEPILAEDPSQPATDFQYQDGAGRVGFINPVTHSFCGKCNRLRLTAEGQIRNCLFSTTEWDARALLRGGGSDEQLAELIESAIGAKRAGHGIDTADFVKPQRAMYQIGG
ncbi:MAG TPA: GTP 3',8-cyclase MoaA [Pirellulales bacterium]|nr:GTP 3',8-cyclase MoaA [Pirellulales bacterium]